MRILGESIALALTHDTRNAEKAAEAAKTFIASQAKETAKVWYTQGSLNCSLLLSVVGLTHFFMTDSQNYTVLMAIVFGIVGAQFSVLSQLAALEVDPAAGKTAHYTEANSSGLGWCTCRYHHFCCIRIGARIGLYQL
ncbi:hypothetical protein GWO43_13700 [candidate division KSB1 bacterium]|nr:hypothetical protein [candidate division KSB1 bacterium]NIR71994.1 hypothetical protein [candidate division KSB1 bacterium]NIS24987.1 hypothetical protein [candidate division KSB1 bacterium]NIT71903.1 hypothetical protein [candidate division KSB1 bacterium]NIU25642.1 hypothetical protein [candidate division KSB1 bacterium]